MKGDRNRITVDDAYLTSFGRASYVFAGLMWNIACSSERLQPSYLDDFKRKSSAQIADDFLGLVRSSGRSDVKESCEAAANEARRLVTLRADLNSSTPFTAEGGEQRLGGAGGVWTPEKIDDTADEFAACSIEFASFLYGILAPSETPA